FADQLRLEFRLLDLLDVDEDLAIRGFLNLLLQLVDLGSLAPDDDPGTRGVDVDLQLVRRALGLDSRNACVREPLLEILPKRKILMEQFGVVAIRVPTRPPGLVEAEPKSVRVNLLAHGLSCP